MDQNRVKDYENSFNHYSAKENKHKSAVELRKSKRELQVQKNRNIYKKEDWVKLNNHYKESYQESELKDILSNLSVTNDSSFLYIAQAVRKISSCESSIKQIISSPLMSCLPAWLERDDFSQLQYESVWICTNISASDFCYVLNQLNFLPLLVSLLKSDRSEIRYQSAWSISNIVVNSSTERDLLVEHGALELLASALKNAECKTQEKVIIWAISGAIRKKKYLEYERVRNALKAVLPVLLSKNRKNIIEVCWTLKIYLNEPDILNELVSQDYYSALAAMLDKRNTRVLSTIVQIFGGIFYYSSECCKIALEKGFAHAIAKCLDVQNTEVKKHTAWTIGNITGDKANFLCFVFEARVFEKIFLCIERSSFLVKAECAWAICNSCFVCSVEQLLRLVELGMMRSLVFLLTEEVSVMMILETIIRVFEIGQDVVSEENQNLVVSVFKKWGGFDVLSEYSLKSKNKEIRRKCEYICVYYDRDDESENSKLIVMKEDTFDI